MRDNKAGPPGPARSWRTGQKNLSFRVPPAPVQVVPGARPSFSILIPAYEAAGVIGRAIRSALAQSEPAKEIVVVDDGSHDDLGAALAPFGGQVRLVTSPHVGLPAARNLAIRHISGDFAAFLDADDELEPDFLEALGSLSAYRPDLDILTTDARFIVDGQPDGTFYEKNVFPVDDQRLAMLRGCFITTKTAVRRSRLIEIGGFDPRLTHGEDWECWLRLVLSGSRVGLVDVPLSRYHLHQGQMSARHGASLRGRLQIMTDVQGRSDVTDRERRQLTRPIRDLTVRAAVVSGVDGEASEARRLWLRLVQSGDAPTATRMGALLAAVAPRLAARYGLRLCRLSRAGRS
ncbi:MAG TPA: glycosyltransferase family A protein [Propionibacteriaceae bacterium]|nr:glycosyltransferase family A protein [Propionibacteriaceae bacterium]